MIRKANVGEEKLKEIFIYTRDEVEKLTKDEKKEIANDFWAKWRNDPDVLKLIDEISDIVEIHTYKHSTGYGIAKIEFYDAGMEVALSYFPFNDINISRPATYLGKHIDGAMKDLKRKKLVMEGINRQTGQAIKKIKSIEFSLGTDFSLSNQKHVGILMDTGVSEDTILNLRTIPHLDSMDGSSFYNDDTSLHEFISDCNAIDPCDALEQSRFLEVIEDAIDTLPERHRLVFTLYHDKFNTLKEIGDVLGVKGSRVSQILSEAHKKIEEEIGISRKLFKGYNNRSIEKPISELEPN